MTAPDRLRLASLGLHPDRVRTLLVEWGNARAVLRAVERGQIEVSQAIRDRLDHDPADAARRAGADIVYREDLPDALAGLPDAPDLLYVRGVLSDRPGVAIVGSRRATSYGLRLARSFGRAVAGAGWPVISGLARGIDGAAHIGCLDGGGVGLAVLGCGVDVAYPREHRDLAARLLDGGGGVVSEYAPGARPEPWRFPPRNRIISGLASVVVVVEATVKGGALITAARALEQGRYVLAVPGDVDRETSRGCNLLIRDGAHPVLDVDDLLTSLTFALGLPPNRPPSANGDDPILRLLRGGGITLEALAVALGCSAPETIRRVSLLEAAGSVRKEGGVVSAR
ncbi:MAG: DNA-protecting protein DprA [Acidimicrobiia bacterium]|nr:MAG: DNA-protecting protein DprA [Acidimicrobiia bacterium]